jgi:hypothetical protein
MLLDLYIGLLGVAMSITTHHTYEIIAEIIYMSNVTFEHIYITISGSETPRI